MLKRLRNSIGLVTIEQLEAKAEQLRKALDQQRKADARLAEVSRALDEARASAAAWKAIVEEERSRAEAARAEVLRLEHRIEKLTVDVDADRARFEARRAKDAERVQLRLDAAERDLRLSREQLMLVEVKLDVLEGAASVLDRRTRAVLEART
jgi:hypothetical protein